VVASILTREGLGMCVEAVNSEAPGGLHGGGCAGRLATYKEWMRQCTALSLSLFPTASCELAYACKVFDEIPY